METEKKLKLLFAAAEYDVCSPTSAKHTCTLCKQQSAPKSIPGVYYAKTYTGKIVPLFKILFTNECVYNCNYCVNRRDRSSTPRAVFTPEELAKVFYRLYRKNIVKGLFLSSAIGDNARKTMEKMIISCEILRKKYHFDGYIHLKILPGAGSAEIEEAVKISTRVSLNMEAPTSGHLRILSREKRFNMLLSTLEMASNVIRSNKKNLSRNVSLSTQLIVGAANESDRDILSAAHAWRKKYNLSRVYFSAFTPIPDTPFEALTKAPILREHRLYQADWLFAFYGFTIEDIVFDKNNNLLLDKDPKLVWAENNLHLFPKEVNTASYEELLRVPGIGPLTARRIVEYRKENKFSRPSDLRKAGVILKRAYRFITLNGRPLTSAEDEDFLQELLPFNL
jgi:putative DNA modification/repair radical SAM protein